MSLKKNITKLYENNKIIIKLNSENFLFVNNIYIY